MTLLLDYIRKKVGWCPNSNTIRTAPVILTAPSVTADASVPDGGAGGPGRLDRGVSLALGSLRILIRNGRLLWFSFLTGLVLVLSFVTTFALQYLSGIHPLTGLGLATASLPVLIAAGSPVWLILTFTSQFVVALCSVILLAGLISCVSLLLSGRIATLREGLSNAGNHLIPIAGWAVVYAIVATVQSVIVNLYPGDLFLTIISGIFFLPLGLITVFVVPVVVLEGKGLPGAVMESLALIRKTWGEIIVCFFVYIVLWFVVAFIALIPAVAVGFPSGDPVLLGLSMGLYLLVLMLLIMLYSTTVGIFLVGLYTYAKTGQVPEMFEEKHGVRVPV
jgi:hypothetical protein